MTWEGGYDWTCVVWGCRICRVWDYDLLVWDLKDSDHDQLVWGLLDSAPGRDSWGLQHHWQTLEGRKD